MSLIQGALSRTATTAADMDAARAERQPAPDNTERLQSAMEKTGLMAIAHDENCPDCGYPEISVLISQNPNPMAPGRYSEVGAYCSQCGWICGDTASVAMWFSALGGDEIPAPIRGALSRAAREADQS